MTLLLISNYNLHAFNLIVRTLQSLDVTQYNEVYTLSLFYPNINAYKYIKLIHKSA